jgi:mono/diheme cytochrome c family protein
MTTAKSLLLVLAVLATAAALAAADLPAGGAAEGTVPYEKFETDESCAACHVDLVRQHRQSLMSMSFTHHWDQIEYFDLALPHARKLEKVAEIEAGCNGCHAPLAFLAGDIPPKRAEENTRANEGVSCDLCHSMVGFKGDVPYNFNYQVDADGPKQGVRQDSESPTHDIAVNPFLKTAEFCGTCHNEKDPYGVWVKSTHLEWKDSPQAEAGIVCQDCHMPPAPGNAAPGMGGKDRPDVRQHTFHGSHTQAKLAGAVEVQLHPRETELAPGAQQQIVATVFNAKAGHMIPTGSAEERLVWLHVEATDASGAAHHLAVDPKGFEGEKWTIADEDAMAYQDIGQIQGIEDFEGLPRDAGVPDGDRIFRLPYLDPQGRMTIAQWHTASLGPDYRLPPLEAKNETFTWTLPEDLPAGEVMVEATVWYSLVVPSVAEFLGVPPEEAEPVKMSEHKTTFTVTAKTGG